MRVSTIERPWVWGLPVTGPQELEVRLRFGEYEVDAAARRLVRDGEPQRIQPKVFDLLVLLLRHRGRVLARDEIRGALWPGVAVSASALDRLVKELRRTLGDDGRRQLWIRTHHGRGLSFAGPVAELPDPEGAAPSTSEQAAADALERARRAGAAGDAREAREALRAAIQAAEATPGARGAELLAKAALGLAGARIGYDVSEHEVAEPLRRAAERLEDAQAGLRARVRARLAAEEHLADAPERLARLREAALRDAEAAEDDPTALSDVLGTPTSGIWDRLAPGRRLRTASEAAARAQRAGARRAETRARLLRLHELFAAGELALFDAELAALERSVDAERDPLVAYGLAFHRVGRATLAGRLEEAEALATEAFELGRRHADRFALDLYGTQLIVIRAEAGRLDELVGPTEAAAEGTAAASPRCLLAWLHARRGDAAAARAAAEAVKARDLARLADLPTARANAGVLAEVAAFLGDTPLAARVAPLLEPEAGRLLLRGVTAVHGPADTFRGLAALARGRASEATRAFEAAQALAERLGAPRWAAAARAAGRTAADAA